MPVPADDFRQLSLQQASSSTREPNGGKPVGANCSSTSKISDWKAMGVRSDHEAVLPPSSHFQK
jgi:hypothetical protein